MFDPDKKNMRKESVEETFLNLFDRGKTFIVTDPKGRLMNSFGKFFEETLADIKDTENEYILKLAVPGFSKENISIECKENTILISGEMTLENEESPKTEKYILKEISSKSFAREFKLSEAIKENEISAKLENGILEIIVPKKEKVEIPVSKIEIK